MSRLVVIGGGVAGAAVVGEYLRGAPRPDLSVTWITGRRAPGRGIAYSTAKDCHLLNVRAAGMGLFADRSGDFLDYLLGLGVSARGSDFVARERFGDFVEATLAHLTAQAARQCVRIDAIASEAIWIAPAQEGGYAIGLREGSVCFADEIVLALGAPPPNPIDGVSASALMSGAYAVDPWTYSAPAAPPRRIIVIGTGLTGVDTVLDVAQRWPEAHITCLSRHGRLPKPHPVEPAEPFEHQAAFNDALLEHSRVRTWLRMFHATLDDHGGELDWRALVDGMRPVTARLWQSLDEAERRRFLRHLRSLWENARHRTPPQTAAAVQALIDAGRLDVRAGQVRAVDGDDPLALRYVPRSGTDDEVLQADLVIQATGFNTDVRTCRPRLIRQLIADGLATPDPLGLGMRTTAEGYLVQANGEVSNGLRAIGTLLRGSLWECTGLPEIRVLARDVVHSWRGRHSSSPKSRFRQHAGELPLQGIST